MLTKNIKNAENKEDEDWDHRESQSLKEVEEAKKEEPEAERRFRRVRGSRSFGKTGLWAELNSPCMGQLRVGQCPKGERFQGQDGVRARTQGARECALG